MAIQARDKEMRPVSDINVTPFVDIMTVLLIIFMITAPLMQQGLDVNLPQAKSPIIEKTADDLVLTIKKDGTMLLGEEKEPLTLGFLENKFNTIYATRDKKDLYINADEGVIYGVVVNVMSIAKAAGVERIGMITRPVQNIKMDNEEETTDTKPKKSASL